VDDYWWRLDGVKSAELEPLGFHVEIVYSTVIKIQIPLLRYIFTVS
jgi:hypothetical protein